MTDRDDSKPPPVTREHFDAAAKLGFVPHYDFSGRLWLIERGTYRELVEAGRIAPGRSLQ